MHVSLSEKNNNFGALVLAGFYKTRINMKYCLIIMICCFGVVMQAQQIFTINVINDEHKPLAGATVKWNEGNKTYVTDSSGKITIRNIANGKQSFSISYVGYKGRTVIYNFPMIAEVKIELEKSEESSDEVVVIATRTSRSISNTPTRVEVISGEEIHEEAEMRPGDIKMLLAESTGIQTQQTSATSASASIRIQGLDGRYTQLLKDGFPLYTGAASGLGLLQTPPLDLRQVEIIKGSSSTLYGGGAIAGLINLISKIPTEKRELNFHINGTTAKGLDINGFYGQRFKKSGITVFVSRNSNAAYDPAHISLSAIPEFERYTLNPKIFLYLSKNTQLNFGINTVYENRLGGDMKVINGEKDNIHQYFERNKTKRLSTQLDLNKKLNDKSNFSFKNSMSYFNRDIYAPSYKFSGKQVSTFTEATWINKMDRADWVIGLNVLSDVFQEKHLSSFIVRNYNRTTLGAFVQNTWNAADWLTLETGLRGDYVIDYGFALLPRISMLFKIAPKFTSRVGGGFGYKAPAIFTEESEKLLYKNVLPIDPDSNKLEKSYGANWDINYKWNFDELSFSVNQFFFYTYLKNPLMLEQNLNGSYSFKNIPGHIDTRGAETNIRIGYDEFSLYLGYTYTNAKVHSNNLVYQNPLTPGHRFNGAFVYEMENKWRVGSEIYYFSKQKLSDGTTGRGYWLTGLLAEKFWKRISVYINFENFGDVRQTKFESIYTGSITNPDFKDIYAPLDGFVVNGGIRVKL